MIEDKSEVVPLLKFSNLSEQKGISHFITTRAGGFSRQPFISLNLGYKCGDETLTVSQNRRALARRLNISSKKMLMPVQTHSNNVKVVKKDMTIHSYVDNNIYFEDSDALVTNVPGLCLIVLVADCVPIIIYDTKNKVIAVVHSGWRGTAGKLAEKTIKTMTDEFMSDPKDIIAGIGPSISLENYEVGNDVVEAFRKALGNDFEKVVKSSDGKTRVDLWEANKLQLLSAGLTENNIEISGICTYNEYNKFFSHRRSEGRTGRFSTGIIINN